MYEDQLLGSYLNSLESDINTLSESLVKANKKINTLDSREKEMQNVIEKLCIVTSAQESEMASMGCENDMLKNENKDKSNQVNKAVEEIAEKNKLIDTLKMMLAEAGKKLAECVKYMHEVENETADFYKNFYNLYKLVNKESDKEI